MATEVSRQVILDGIEVLRRTRRVEWSGGGEVKPGVHSLASPDYDDRVWGALVSASELLGTDSDYMSSIDAIADQRIAALTREQLATLLTYMLRGERFVTGHVAGYIEDGRLLEALEAALGFLDADADAEADRMTDADHRSAPPLTICVMQRASVPSDVAANLAALDTAAAEARAGGADLLITPEMFVTGYAIGDDIGRLAAEQPLERVAEIAARHGIGIVAGGPELLQAGKEGASAPRVANSAWLFDDTGAVLARHRKIQLYGELDRAHFVAGDAPVTMATYRGIGIAMLVCFDTEYPEAVRHAALAGADLVAVPTAQMAPFEFVNEHMIRVRAWENTVYLAYANQVGPDGDFTYVGRSVIASPRGEHLAEAGPDENTLLFAMVDPAVVAEMRVLNPYLAEVRRDLFAVLVRAGTEPATE